MNPQRVFFTKTTHTTPVQVFFNINSTNATQEDVIYANEYFGSLEYEGPVLWPGDFAIWIRHDDVVHFQKKHHAACLISGPAPCSTQTNPCELIRYQSLDNTGTEGGHGLTGLTHAQKDANDHDADGLDNDQHKDPKCARPPNPAQYTPPIHLPPPCCAALTSTTTAPWNPTRPRITNRTTTANG